MAGNSVETTFLGTANNNLSLRSEKSIMFVKGSCREEPQNSRRGDEPQNSKIKVQFQLSSLHNRPPTFIWAMEFSHSIERSFNRPSWDPRPMISLSVYLKKL